MNESRGNRIHIGIYGKRNVGKSTIFNLILGQEMSIVSDIKGTTTDSNIKAMELHNIGAVSLIDTAGYDDIDELGEKRKEKTKHTLSKIDCAIVVFDNKGISDSDKEFLEIIKNKKIPCLAIINNFNENKISVEAKDKILNLFLETIEISAKNIKRDVFLQELTKKLFNILKEKIEADNCAIPPSIKPKSNVILVIPIDKEAPKGRLILPQVQIIRELLDKSCITTISGVSELEETLNNLKQPPSLAIVDSQVFKEVNKIIPNSIKLTSFSVLFANLKGDIETFKSGANKLDSIKNEDKILVLESCTHHPVEDDIGRVKIPNLIRKYTGKNLEFEHYSGCDFPENIDKYSLIIHCGACMTNRAEILSRIAKSKENNIPITNYGIVIAKCLGILNRALEIFN